MLFAEPASRFRAFNDPMCNLLVLFKLHRLAGGQELDLLLTGDKIFVPVE